MSLKFKVLNKTVVSGGAGVQISSDPMKIRSAIIYAPSGNAGDIFIGNSDANAKVGTAFELKSGEAYVLDGDEFGGDKHTFDLSEFYYDGTTSDKIVIHYFI